MQRASLGWQGFDSDPLKQKHQWTLDSGGGLERTYLSLGCWVHVGAWQGGWDANLYGLCDILFCSWGGILECKIFLPRTREVEAALPPVMETTKALG